MSKHKNLPHIIGSIVGAMLCVLLLPVAAFNITMAVKGYMDPNKVPMVLGFGSLIVDTGSMKLR